MSVDPIELPHGELPSPMLPPSSEITWLPRRRRHTPRHQRQPWQDPRIATIIQRMAPAFVAGQVASASGSSGTITVTLPSNVTPGNCIVVGLGNATATFTAPTDGLGNLYAVAVQSLNTGNSHCALYIANNAVGGACTISVVTGSVATTVIVAEYSGIGSIAGNRTIADVASGAASNTAAPTSGSGAVQQSGCMLIGIVTEGTGGLTWTPGGALANRRASVPTTWDLAMADAVLSSTSIGSVTPSWSNGGTTAQCAWVYIILRPAGTQAFQRAANAANSATSTFISFTTQKGDTMVVAVQTSSSSLTTSTVVDAHGNVWTRQSVVVNASGGELSVWTATETQSAGGQNVTATMSGTGNISMIGVSAYGVIPSANIVDVIATATGNGTAVSVGPSSATSLANEFALLFIGTNSNSGALTAGGSARYGNANPNSASTYFEHQLLTTTGAQTMTATLGTSGQWSGVVITFEVGGAPGNPLSIVQSVSATATSGNLTPTLPFNTAPGNLLCAKAQVNNQTGLSSVTGTNTWSRAKTTPNASGGTLDTWYAKNITGGKVQPTFAPGAVKSGVLLYELSGFDTTAPFDVAANSTGNGQSPSVVTGVPNNLFSVVFGGVGDVAAGKSITVTSPAAAPQAAIATNVDLAAGFYTVFSPGAVPSAQTFGASIPTSASQYSADAVLFKIAGSGAYTQGITTTNPGTGSDSGTGLLTHKGITSTNAGQGSESATGKLSHFGVTTTNAGTGSTAATGKLYHYGVTVTNPGVGSASITGHLRSGIIYTHTVSGAIVTTHTLTATIVTEHILDADIVTTHTVTSEFV